MTIQLPADLAAALSAEATQRGIAPQLLVEQALRESLVSAAPTPTTSQPSLEPIDEWERKLLAIGRPCGVSLSDEALSSEGLYD